jgi:hypothetical protein
VQVSVNVVLSSIGGVVTDPDGSVALKLRPPPEIVQADELASE